MKRKRIIATALVLLIAMASLLAATKFTSENWHDDIGTGKTVKSAVSSPVDMTITTSDGKSSDGTVILRFFRTKNGPALAFFFQNKGSDSFMKFSKREPIEMAIKLDYGRTVRMNPEHMFDNCPITLQDHDMRYVFNQFKNCKFLDITVKAETTGTTYAFHIEYDKDKFIKTVSQIID